MEPWVQALALDLEFRRGWGQIAVGDKIIPGDVGVVIVDKDTHHIYLVVKADDQKIPNRR